MQPPYEQSRGRLTRRRGRRRGRRRRGRRKRKRRRKGGRPQTHWERGESELEWRSKERLPLWHRALTRLCPTPVSLAPLCNAKESWEQSESMEREAFIHTHSHTHQEREGREMLCPHMICSFPPPWHGFPGNQGKRGGGWGENQPMASFLFYIKVEKKKWKCI